MSNFIDDLTSLPFPKNDAKPIPVGADPTQYFASVDWNALCQAVLDLRLRILANDVPKTRSITGGAGLTGGGDLTADRTIALPTTAVTPASYSNTALTVDQYGRITAAASGAAVPPTRAITAGTGLTGGGDLSADRSLVLANTAVTPGSYSNTTATVDQQGRITAMSNGVASNFGMFGDGSDGALSGTRTLVRDLFCTTYTGAAADVVTLSGYRLFCTGALIGPASGTFTIQSNGGPGTSTGVASVAAPANLMGGSSSPGVASGTGNGSTPSATGTIPTDFRPGLGGAGGAGNGTTAGAGASFGTFQASTIGSFNQLLSAVQGRAMTTNTTPWTGGTAGGNGGGGSGSGGVGGTGGAGGGYTVVLAKSVINPANVSIEAKGGNGGAGGLAAGSPPGPSGAAGGGGGGGGGYCVHVCGSGTPATQSAAGGLGGAGTSGGAVGVAGSPGRVVTFNLSS